MKSRYDNLLVYLAKNLLVVVSLVLIWRGIWYALDILDKFFFGGSHLVSSVGGIVIGLLLLFLPDHDLKEIEKL